MHNICLRMRRTRTARRLLRPPPRARVAVAGTRAQEFNSLSVVFQQPAASFIERQAYHSLEPEPDPAGPAPPTGEEAPSAWRGRLHGRLHGGGGGRRSASLACLVLARHPSFSAGAQRAMPIDLFHTRLTPRKPTPPPPLLSPI